MLKKTVTALTKEISDEHNFAIKTAVFDYLLMDEEEQKRLNISQSRPRFRYFFLYYAFDAFHLMLCKTGSSCIT